MELTTSSTALTAQHGCSLPAEWDGPQTLVLAFGPSDCLDRPESLMSVIDRYPQSHILGCSTAGEIFGTDITDHHLSVAVARFEATPLRTASAPLRSPSHSFEAGREVAHTLLTPDLRAVLVLSDGLKVNGSELVRGLNSVLPGSVVITGGLAGDGAKFQRTWVLKGRKTLGGFVTALGLYGSHIQLGHGSKGGWDIFGPERKITRSKENVLYELDGKPALQLYKDYLGERATGLPATGLLFPLALRAHSGDSKQLVRTILAVDEATQSMTFAGNVPEGHLAQLMRANFDRLIEGASLAAQASRISPPGPTLAIAISCVGRRLILGERAEEETEATQEALPPRSQQVGFYSYGEISPFATGSCDLHNQTMTLTTIGEA